MMAPASIFFEFNLPNATTWFYFSLLLAVALFFKFSRLLSVRNWDVVTVFLLVPGFLLLQQSRANPVVAEKPPAAAVASLVAGSGAQAMAGPTAGLSGLAALAPATELPPKRMLWFGYLWLLVGSGYLLVRCLLDLVLVRRPALAPNLTFGGLAWLAGALFICLVAVAFRQPDRGGAAVALSPAPLTPESPAVSKKEGKVSPPLQVAQRLIPWWASRGFAMLCHLAVVAGLVVIGLRHFQEAGAGMAAATFYLMLPYTGQHVGQVHHVWPTALLVWALACYRRPALAGLFLGVAAATIYFPVLLFPLWLSFYWKRGAGRFTASFCVTAGLCLAATALLFWLRPDLARLVGETIAATDWQPWSVPNAEGIWTEVHWAYRIPVFLAYLAFVLTTVLWPMPKNLAHLIALSAAVLIGIQFWYADQGGVYVLWYLPLFMLLVFRPNLSDRVPAPIQSDRDWLVRLGQALGRVVRKALRLPEPMVRVG
jgi:hypothetical protein